MKGNEHLLHIVVYFSLCFIKSWSTTEAPVAPNLINDEILVCGNVTFTLYDGFRHLVENVDLLLQYEYDLTNFTKLTNSELERYPEGLPLIRFRKLAPTIKVSDKPDPTIYILKDGKIVVVTDWDWFLLQGFHGEYYNLMSEEHLARLPRHSISLADEVPEGVDAALANRDPSSLVKVIVPSVYKEWEENPPEWATSDTLQTKYNYSVFIYQKHHPHKPNYIAHNRGTEAGVYLRYIVDHYDNFPDVAMFVHAMPEDHAEATWLQYVGCINPTATYMSINIGKDCGFIGLVCRSPDYWKEDPVAMWIEQCWRDVLKTIWEVETPGQAMLFNQRIPINHPLRVCCVCCQQFILSRETMRRRPLRVWKALLHMIGEQDVCHQGEPDYENLHQFHRHYVPLGPEPSKLPHLNDEGYGQHTQGVAMEHLAHVVFGFQPLDMAWPNQSEVCSNFLPNCPGSPCTQSVVPS